MNLPPSKLIRRTHMYLALFLTPWLIVYALSGLVLNHVEIVRGFYGGKHNQFEKVGESEYSAAFPENANPRMIGAQILDHLELAGPFNVQEVHGQPKLIINRKAAFALHRITYLRNENRLLVEKQRLSVPLFMNELHFRNGYDQPFLASKIWGLTVDLVVVAMLFWVASGIWMWWEIKPARWSGAAFALTGFGMFGILLFTI